MRPLLCTLVPLVFIAGAHPQPAERMVAITIDDLPVTAVSVSTDWASVTERLLAALRAVDRRVGRGALMF